MNVAVIDIGSNTAHLLVANLRMHHNQNIGLDILTKKRHYTYLGEDGLKTISDKACKRLYQALEDFTSLQAFKDSEIKRAIATDALRNARNGEDIRNHITSSFNLTPEIITGSEEAQFLWKAIEHTYSKIDEPNIIVDIGGGSVEVILAADRRPKFMVSLPIGISRLYNRMTSSDPITPEEIDEIERDINMHLVDLKLHLETHKTNMIGMAGTFEIFGSSTEISQVEAGYRRLTSESFYSFCSEILKLDYQSRLNHPAVPEVRAKYVVMALILIRTLFRSTRAEHLVISDYSIKEGIAIDTYLSHLS